jgi:hypothetical protein
MAAGGEEAFEMRDLDTGQQQVIFDLESGVGVRGPLLFRPVLQDGL